MSPTGSSARSKNLAVTVGYATSDRSCASKSSQSCSVADPSRQGNAVDDGAGESEPFVQLRTQGQDTTAEPNPRRRMRTPNSAATLSTRLINDYIEHAPRLQG